MRYTLPPELLRLAFPLLVRSEDSVARNTVGRVALRKILVGAPTSPEKLARCKRRVEERWTVPAIHAERFWLYNQDYYVLSEDGYLAEDSLHRVVAARQCGHVLILTRVHVDHWCKPNMYRIDPAKAILWRQTNDGWQFIKSELTTEQVQVLRLLGVSAMTYGRRLPNDTIRIP